MRYHDEVAVIKEHGTKLYATLDQFLSTTSHRPILLRQISAAVDGHLRDLVTALGRRAFIRVEVRQKEDDPGHIVVVPTNEVTTRLLDDISFVLRKPSLGVKCP